MLQLNIRGKLGLQCQRCLKALEYELSIASQLRLVPEALLDSEQSDDPEEPDCIAACAELDLMIVIEDEILLELPSYPMHEKDHCGVSAQAGAQKVSAFSALAVLNPASLKSKLKE